MRVERASRPLKMAVVYSRLPLPMNRTDQMTVAHLLDFLAKRGHQVDLYTLDNGEPILPEQGTWLTERCRSLKVFRQRRGHNLMGMLTCLCWGLPLQIGWFYNARQIQALRAAMARDDLDLVYCYYIRSAEAARYPEAIKKYPCRQAPGRPVRFLAMQLSQSLNTRRMVDNFQNLRDLAIYKVESKLTRRYEAHIWAYFDRTVLIGSRDLEEIKKVCREYSQPEIDNYIFGPHGVDIQRFAPRPQVQPDPYTLVYCGRMGTNTNIHAVTWFAEKVWPLVKRAEPEARLLVVGRRPTPAIKALASWPGITVTGEVPDPADYLARALVCINTVQAGAGMQNKLIEYLAMGKPVVATSMANEGIGATPGEHLLIADSPREFAAHILWLFKDAHRRAALGSAARAFIEANWSWERHFLNLEREMYTALEARAG